LSERRAEAVRSQPRRLHRHDPTPPALCQCPANFTTARRGAPMPSIDDSSNETIPLCNPRHPSC
ncbi:MAG: hypothetical protein WKF75_14385, partial [Singulisphaera sp.]